MLKMKLKDGAVREVAEGTTIAEFVKNVSNSLAKKVLAAKLDGKTVDLMTPLTQDASIAFLTFEDEDGRWALRHTASHILAQALKRLYKDENVKLAIGPAIDNGFYYDIDMDRQLGEGDLADIEKEMKKIVKENLKLERKEVSRQDALDFFEKAGETYKVELINDLPEGEDITLYTQGEFTDLCAGPHVVSTGKVKALKLMSVAGAYWRGDEHNKMLQRIYGTAFEKQADLDAYLHMLEEAKKRDHRKLGKQLDLFSLHEEGPGFPFFHPNGMVIRNELINYWREVHRRYGYQEIKTPIILNRQLWETSGHWDHYKENMYFTKIDDEDYAIKPMNCPGHIQIFNQKLRSYRDLPIRMAEFGNCLRNEPSGSLHGLMRVRGFTQDDAHLFVREDQIMSEVSGCIKMVFDIYKTFGFNRVDIKLSLRPEKRIGDDAMWDRAEKDLADALKENGLSYELQPGEGAFYGPKIEFTLYDSLGRAWQCGTVQLDFALPGRLDASYIAEDGSKKVPVMIHRAVLGSLERFIGILTENFAGYFPVWLAPVQVELMNITDHQIDYVKKVESILRSHGIRVKSDLRNEKIGFKIREHTLLRVPFLVVCGDKEMESGEVAVRTRRGADLGKMKIEDFAAKVCELMNSRSLEEI